MKSFNECPVCNSPEKISVREDLKPHPYVGCKNCGLYYQPNPVSKIYEAPHEHRGDLMSDADKKINYNLAKFLYNFWEKNSTPAEKEYHLDIGTKYPYLGHCLQNISTLTSFSPHPFKSYGIDGIDLIGHFGKELDVQVLQTDFESPIETWDFSKIKDSSPFLENKFSIITLVHCIEHFYNPMESIQKIHKLGRNEALVFIRCPDNEVEGIERDFTYGHYLIHPLIWNLSSLKKALDSCNNLGLQFELLDTYSFSGQRDLFLKIKK